MIDGVLYRAESHNIIQVLTEHTCESNVLACLVTGPIASTYINVFINKQTGIHSQFEKGTYFFKSHKEETMYTITRETFFSTLCSFEQKGMTVSQEIVEKLYYTDKRGKLRTIPLIIKIKEGGIRAWIDFPGIEESNDFIPPAWLIPAYETAETKEKKKR